MCTAPVPSLGRHEVATEAPGTHAGVSARKVEQRRVRAADEFAALDRTDRLVVGEFLGVRTDARQRRR